MKKSFKVGSGLLALLMTATLAGCVTPPEESDDGNNNNGDNMIKTYAELYDGNAKSKYGEVGGLARYRASYGYTDNSEQGYNRWSYLGGSSPMEYKNGVWSGGGSQFAGGVMKLSQSSVTLRFDPPATGNVTVSGTLRMAEEGGGATLKVMSGSMQIYPQSGALEVDGADLTGRYFSFTTPLATQPLDFVISGTGSVYCNPCVDYTNAINDSLYGTPEWGYYGDLHAYYHDDTVNMYHLQNTGEDMWEWHLDTTKNMFLYERATFYDTSFVKDHYMAYSTAGDLVDYSVYPDGGRDCTLFYDEDSEVYRYIGLTYKNKTGIVNCDLSIRSSVTDDLYGDWNMAIPLREFPNNSGEPECAAFRKIDGTWYLYAGISHQTVHAVGGLSYWKGEKGDTIDMTDWVHAQTYRLDGEDLCVPQIEEIGGRYYMWGWMPQSFNNYQWGGYMNLPREVFVRENGLLGTRLDEMATKLVNRGKLIDVNAQTATTGSGQSTVGDKSISMTGTANRTNVALNADSTFVTFTLDMKNSTEAGYIMNANGREYRVLLVKRADGVYMQVGCPQEGSHPVSSELYLGDGTENIYNCKIVSDGVWRNGSRNGSNVEFYVNDTLALSARLNLDMSNGYTPSFYSDRLAEFTNIEINRLAQKYDIYD